MTERLLILYGTHKIDVTIKRRARKTLEISVEPDATVVAIAPKSASREAIVTKVQKRAGWIRRQQRFFAQYLPRTPDRQFVPGETHLYLGRHYRLKVVRDTNARVALSRGFLMVYSQDPDRPDNIKELLERWYRDRATYKFAERLDACLQHFSTPERFRPRQLIIRQLRQRWGSMSPSRRLLLNRRLIEAPVEAIDYVITHELCHIKVPNHGPRFYDFLTQTLPDWPKRKQRLELIMA